MKRIGKVLTASVLAIVLACASFFHYAGSYTYSYDNAVERLENEISQIPGMAADLCVANADILPDGELESAPSVAGLFDLTNQKVLYAKNIHQSVQPASITKLLTALVTLKYGNLQDKVSVSKNALITESGAKLCGFYPGDDLTLEQALYGLLVYSGNDAGVVIAEHISGSVEAFAQLMNQEAQAIGATNTHFVNPHGLTAKNHETTVYDLYLIFSELLKYPKFLEIIQTRSYTYYPNNPNLIYKSSENSISQEEASGKSVPSGKPTQTPANRSQFVWENTNWYFTGEATAPDGITVIGGKTGTTYAVGACLILLSEDAQGNRYISAVMGAKTKPDLYLQMSDLLKEISK